MSSTKLLWEGTFVPANSAAPNATQLLSTGPKDGEKRRRSSNDDDDNEKTIEELERELNRKRERLEQKKKENVPQRIAILERKIASDTAEMQKLEESIRKDKIELQELNRQLIPRDAMDKAARYYKRFAAYFDDDKQFRIRTNYGLRRYFSVYAQVQIQFEDYKFANEQSMPFVKSTKLALVLQRDSIGSLYNAEILEHIRDVADSIPSAEDIKLLKSAHATIRVQILQETYETETSQKLLSLDGLQVVKWGYDEEHEEPRQYGYNEY